MGGSDGGAPAGGDDARRVDGDADCLGGGGRGGGGEMDDWLGLGEEGARGGGSATVNPATPPGDPPTTPGTPTPAGTPAAVPPLTVLIWLCCCNEDLLAVCAAAPDKMPEKHRQFV